MNRTTTTTDKGKEIQTVILNRCKLQEHVKY